MLENIYINYDNNLNSWTLSKDKPEFQGGLSMTIDEKTAKEILFCKSIKQEDIIEEIPQMKGTIENLNNIKI